MPISPNRRAQELVTANNSNVLACRHVLFCLGELTVAVILTNDQVVGFPRDIILWLSTKIFYALHAIVVRVAGDITAYNNKLTEDGMSMVKLGNVCCEFLAFRRCHLDENAACDPAEALFFSAMEAFPAATSPRIAMYTSSSS